MQVVQPYVAACRAELHSAVVAAVAAAAHAAPPAAAGLSSAGHKHIHITGSLNKQQVKPRELGNIIPAAPE